MSAGLNQTAAKIGMGHTRFSCYLFNCTTKSKAIASPKETEAKIIDWVLNQARDIPGGVRTPTPLVPND